MATVTITTTQEERDKVLKAIQETQGETIAMAKIAKMCGLSTSRVRYVIQDLVDDNKIRKVATKSINKCYVRYKYETI